MAAPVPRDEVIDIFNKVAALDVGDGEEASRYAIRLMRLCRQRPRDFACHAALARALRMSGDREGGLRAFGQAWALQDQADYAAMTMLAAGAVNFGLMERIRPLVPDVWLRRDRPDPGVQAMNAVVAGLVLGYANLVLKAAEFEAATVGPGWAARYADVFNGSDIAPYLEGHQSVVMSVIGQHQCCVELDLLEYDDSDVPTIFLIHHLSVESGELKRLRNALFDAVEEYYASIGISPAMVAPYFHNSLEAMPRTPVLGLT